MSETTETGAADGALADTAQGDAANTPPADTGIFDAAGAAAAGDGGAAEGGAAEGGGAGKPVRPEGVPDQFWDAEKGVRVDALTKSWNDMRTQVAKLGDAKPPEDESGYVLPKVEGFAVDSVPADDPVVGALRRGAAAAGIGAKQFQTMLAPVLKAIGDLGGGPASAEARAAEEKRAFEAEMGKLGANGRAIVRETGAWLNGLAGRGILTREEVGALRSVTSAEGVRAFAKLRELAGGAPIPVEGLAEDGAMTQADAERMMREGYAKNDAALVAKGRAVLERMEGDGRLGR